MPYRDSEANRYTGKVRWRQGNIFDADDRVSVLALSGAEEVSLEDASQVFVDDGPAAELARDLASIAPRRRRESGLVPSPISETADAE